MNRRNPKGSIGDKMGCDRPDRRPGVRVAMVRDPDGNMVELVESDPLRQTDFK
jgi:catechol 2,3-dioxygenase-like lactoylglutathione lyase family enzyme